MCQELVKVIEGVLELWFGKRMGVWNTHKFERYGRWRPSWLSDLLFPSPAILSFYLVMDHNNGKNKYTLDAWYACILTYLV